MKFHRLASAAAPISAATTRPARTPGVAAALAISRTAAMRSSVRQASPNSNLRLKSMLLHAPVKRAAREAELGGGERHVEVVHPQRPRSEEHTSELQSRFDLVCRLLLEKKKKRTQ